jgi:redox-sensing transcriptional repressor
MDDLAQVIVSEKVSIGVIATPANAAQQVCDRLVGCGVTSVLNSTVLAVPAGVDVRKVDLAVELQILSFHETRKSRAAAAVSAAAPTVVAGAPEVVARAAALSGRAVS